MTGKAAEMTPHSSPAYRNTEVNPPYQVRGKVFLALL